MLAMPRLPPGQGYGSRPPRFGNALRREAIFKTFDQPLLGARSEHDDAPEHRLQHHANLSALPSPKLLRKPSHRSFQRLAAAVRDDDYGDRLASTGNTSSSSNG